MTLWAKDGTGVSRPTTRADEPVPIIEPVSNGKMPVSQSKKWSVQPRPTHPLGLGSPEFSHSRGVSVLPPASTTTFASSLWTSPVRVSRPGRRRPRLRWR